MTPKSPVLTRSMQTRITRITREQIDAPTICHDEHRTAHRALDDCGVLSAVVERDDEG